jgi:hypothetical protein
MLVRFYQKQLRGLEIEAPRETGIPYVGIEAVSYGGAFAYAYSGLNAGGFCIY